MINSDGALPCVLFSQCLLSRFVSHFWFFFLHHLILKLFLLVARWIHKLDIDMHGQEEKNTQAHNIQDRIIKCNTQQQKGSNNNNELNANNEKTIWLYVERVKLHRLFLTQCWMKKRCTMFIGAAIHLIHTSYMVVSFFPTYRLPLTAYLFALL